ncbi:MAG TPA: helix-turn-helix domain-containing protein [Trebonia sp.]
MSSESSPQPSPQPGPAPRPEGAPGSAELARTPGYDPAARPGSAPSDGTPDVHARAAAAEAPASDEPFKLTDAKAMRAVAHPLRVALLDLFGYHQTLTATQASEALGESPANCAFHLRTLAKYGFLREAGGGKGRERPWTLVNRQITITAYQQDPQVALAADELGRVWIERWTERARRVFGIRNQVPGWEEASGWWNSHVFLTPDEAAGLREEMRRLLRRFEGRLSDPALRPEGALPVEWTLFVSPVTENVELAEPGPAAGLGEPEADDVDGPDGPGDGDDK